MFFPIKTDRRLHHTPVMNYAIITINVLVFVVVQRGSSDAASAPYWLNSLEPRLEQFITYQFFHADWMHLIGNMLFLYVFGNSVEDRFGKVGYAAFYLAGGVLAGLGHISTSQAPVLGASGAVSAVTGAYLALFPKSNVTIVYWFIFIGAFEVSGMVLILFQVAQNIFMQLVGAGRVSYLAHLTGYAFGFVIGMSALWVHLLPREPCDMLSLIEHRRKRSRFRRMTHDGFEPWQSQPTSTQHSDDAPLSEIDEKVMAIRAQIRQAIDQHNLDRAAEFYAQLLDVDPGQIMPQGQQLDIANQLMAQGNHTIAARAYELFLNRFKTYPQREQVELILALLYVKYLDRRQRARELLTSALPRLDNDDQQAMARRMLTDID